MVLGGMAARQPMHFYSRPGWLVGLHRTVETVRLVIPGAPGIAIETERTIALVIGDWRRMRTVYRQLSIVRTDPMTVSIAIGEQPPLQHFVRGRTNARYEMRRVESGLLDLGKVVFRIAIKDHAANRHLRIVTIGPYLGKIKWIVSVVGSLGCRHDLHLDGP